LSESDAIVRAKARSIILDWGIVRPDQLDVNAIAAEFGLIIVEKSIIGSAARLICNTEGGLIVVNKTIREPGRKRFAAAHELGHFVLHKSQVPIRVCTEESFLNWYSKSDFEAESNGFAAELLMPTDLFHNSIKRQQPSFRIIESLCEEYQTTLTATSIRFVELGGEACALVASQNAKVKWICKSRNFPFRIISKNDQLDPVSCAGDYFRTGAKISEPETVAADAWLEDKNPAGNYSLFEDLRTFESYGMALSLLWLNENKGASEQRSGQRGISESEDPEHFTPDGKRYRW
jgi:Zn-dependent peptidase ImmA (M78 family)